MCGIWAVLSKKRHGFSVKDIAVAKSMMIVTSLRGYDSSGIFVTEIDKPENPAKVIRTVGDPFNILLSEQGEKFLDYAYKRGQAMVGHGRAATKGNINVKNAHPFKEGPLCLVHNGTIHTGLEKYESKDVEVDSHALTHMLVEEGVEQGLKKTNGAFAVVLHDTQNKCIWFARNYQRPLAIFENHEAIYIMSTIESLDFVLKTNGLLHYQGSREVPAHKLHQFSLYENKLSIQYPLIDICPWQNTQPGGAAENPTQTPSATTTKSSTQTIGTAELEFIVDRIERQKGNSLFKYVCIGGPANEVCEVVFHSKVNDPTLITALGRAKPTHIEKYNGKRIYVVRFKDINWEEGTPEAKKHNQPEATPQAQQAPWAHNVTEIKARHTIVTYGGKKIERGWLTQLLNTSTCSSCQEAIPVEDAHDTMVTESNHLVCRHCLKEIEKFRQGEPIDEHTVSRMIQ